MTHPGAVVVKPVQTGAADGDSDAREITRLTGVEVLEWTTLDEPLAPDTAARRQGVDIPTVASYAERIAVLPHDTVIVEGAGGLLVRLDTEGGTLLDLAAGLASYGLSVGVVVVVAGASARSTTPSSPSMRCGRVGSSPPGWSSARGRPTPAWPSGATSRTCLG